MEINKMRLKEIRYIILLVGFAMLNVIAALYFCTWVVDSWGAWIPVSIPIFILWAFGFYYIVERFEYKDKLKHQGE